MSREITIRLATDADVDTLLAFRKAMFVDMGWTDPATIDRNMPAFRQWYLEQKRGPDVRGWLAEGPDGPVGSAMAWVYRWFPSCRDPRTELGYLFNVYVLPEWRRRGIARRVVDAALDWLTARGVRNISLHASEQGRPLYASQGFAPEPAYMVLKDLPAANPAGEPADGPAG